MVKILKVLRDEFATNPCEFDNLGTMVCWHPQYELGNDHNFKSPQDFQRWVKEEVGKSNIVLLPLYLYDHSGLAISTVPFGDPWDSGQVGWVYATKEDLRREFGAKKITSRIKQKAVSILQEEVKTYNQYLTGEVFGFATFEVGDGKVRETDSCWGFYGSDVETNGMLEYVSAEFKDLLQGLGRISGGEILLIDGEQKHAFRLVREFRDHAAVTPLQDLINLHANLDFIFRAA